jgi:predicted TIM-barrel fold metal-dependent hydrolase
MPQARRLAEQFPDLRVILGHAGFPLARDPDYHEQWKRGITELAQADNVSCKISGLGMADHRWDINSWRPWVLHCIEAFRVDRCMFGSNWPVDGLYASYETVLAAFDTITTDFSHDEREGLFNRNTARIYRVGEDPKGAV